jgi:D-aspartate ligase
MAAAAHTMNGHLAANATALLPAIAGNPPVIILNMFYSGLGIARDLKGRGGPVLGLSADPKIYGNFTRCCEVRTAPNSQEQPEQLFQMLLRLSAEFHGAVIFPTRDADVLFLDRFRVELERHYRLAIPPHDRLMRVMNKYALATLAQEAGIPVPRTSLISCLADLALAQREVGFPCVLKPVLAVNWRGKESWIKAGARKAVRIDDTASLEREYKVLSGIDPEVLMQEWISGNAEQIVVLGGYVRAGGELAQYFTARKLVQSPDDFGTGCLVESVEIPEIVELSRRLFRGLGYEGMAEVEFKHDSVSGEYRLIEINTRHWDWHRLGSASGINLSWTAYCDLVGRDTGSEPRRTLSAKWIAEDALFVYLLRALYRRRVRISDVVHKLSGPRVYAVSSWSDPQPGLRYWVQEFLPGLAKSCWQGFFGGSPL